MDVHSNVDCLRGINNKEFNNDIKNVNPRIYESNNIFSNDKFKNRNYNSFNVSHKKQYNNNNNVNSFKYNYNNGNNNDDNYDLISVSGIKRKDRNQSQFTIN